MRQAGYRTCVVTPPVPENKRFSVVAQLVREFVDAMRCHTGRHVQAKDEAAAHAMQRVFFVPEQVGSTRGVRAAITVQKPNRGPNWACGSGCSSPRLWRPPQSLKLRDAFCICLFLAFPCFWWAADSSRGRQGGGLDWPPCFLCGRDVADSLALFSCARVIGGRHFRPDATSQSQFARGSHPTLAGSKCLGSGGFRHPSEGFLRMVLTLGVSRGSGTCMVHASLLSRAFACFLAFP